MAAAMEHVRKLGEIRELQRRNIAAGIGDADGTDERVVEMYRSLIDTAGLDYQGVVMHDKVAKPLSAAQIARVPTKTVDVAGVECPLCMEPMPVGTRAASLPCCGKFFCHSKIRPHDRWAANPNEQSCCGIENWCAQLPSLSLSLSENWCNAAVSLTRRACVQLGAAGLVPFMPARRHAITGLSYC